jgi:hypothetical protein
MNETDAAIMSKLSNGSALIALLADTTIPSIYSWQAPDNSPYPFVVFNDQSDAELNETRRELHDMIYQVRGFTKASMKAAKAIDYQVRLLLHHATLSVTGFGVLKIDRIASVRFVENQPSTDKVYSAGGLYRLRVERTS